MAIHKGFWPVFHSLKHDANESHVPLGTALKANASLVEMGVDSLGPEAIDRHIARTADLSDENGQTVAAVQLALYAYFMLEVRHIEHVSRRDIASQWKEKEGSF